MTDTKDTGGPAFPVAYGSGRIEGMTLRDYFAAHAPEPPVTWQAKKDAAENNVAWRWAYAAAMLEARQS